MPLHEETLRLRIAILGTNHPETMFSRHVLASEYLLTGRLAESLPLFQLTADAIERRKYVDHFAAPGNNNAATAFESAKQFGTAEDWRRGWLAVVRVRQGPTSLECASELAGLGANLLAQQKWTEAEAVLREANGIGEQRAPDVWVTFNVQSMLGGALLGQKKYDDAEKQLLSAYEGMKSREHTTASPNAKQVLQQGLSRAADWLVVLYAAQGDVPKLEHWREERKQYPPPTGPKE